MTHPENLILRPAIAVDELTLHRLVREGHINPMGIRWERFVVIEAPDGAVIACGQIKPHSDGTHELASLVVDPAWRGRGLSRRIILHLVASHTGPLYLVCRSTLGPMYGKYGFRKVAEADMPRYFRRLKRFARIPEILTGSTMLVMAFDGAAFEAGR